MDEPTVGRGPDQFHLALAGFERQLKRMRQIEYDLERHAAGLREAQHVLLEDHGLELRPQFGKAMTAALQVLAGDPFWEREPVA